MHFADVLTDATQKKSPVCVGLDPALDKLPEGIAKDAKGLLDFSTGIIDAVKDIAACVKPQMAYYEALGWEGMRAFFETCAYAKLQGLLVIADGKRNDIGSTCDAYADAYLSKDSPIDALTISPYLGSDGIKPFIERCNKNDKGIFVLVKTSNPSSGELQDLTVGDETVHEHMAQLVDGWGLSFLGKESGYSCVGAVVGATYPEELKYLRSLLSHAILLIPGYGAQGGTAADIKAGFVNGNGAIVNSSRGIIFASKGKDWREAAGKAAEKMKMELKSVLN
ncbi:MAG TPA: orotidine-5'-phosphate decarboxylase [Candidatus Peribacter riflensis]|uniref:Orotidine 5'-phosphate decarboxylase n=1 Tax=Candidatus Peribacter riflensis TaxID=1735162 RepID=A0A0S1SPZ7_9BACT|nr:MAG: orotidine 5''-phosphate decarboxylase, subfamily 2 [Candidatus Peribacter riflensis]OGJ77971.1 MAG: orotidine 5'-phosphate decarboxylase [Candidatus Peribacteria bacterium RIFOXYB1_FULL_57_12]OGJ82194.1 MAG: orotidine 5'-phosphate decarboxylase [Candidatus Peribacteria bacterium RIFOXYC1_FULL_58_8]ALM11515.1 MAG: orotidine 5''-phosphate decarboxylase, subfamily 2 [Candidatus Peribacter riflensis]ALM12617.1 MAG: orotidine 5''-phosphate decarboxylase, subfamily 2 [Candidatus Peribacter ri